MSKKIQQHYEKKAHFWAKILIKGPGVLAIFLSGSLAQSRANKYSDIDFFVVTKSGQIFTARFFIAGILKLFGVLADDATNHAGKICPNHYITVDNLEIKEKDEYAANLFAHNKFLAGDKNIWYGFVQKNKNWIEKFGKKFQNDSILNTDQPLFVPPKKGETGLVFKKIEAFCEKFQKKKLAKRKLPPSAKVWLTDKEIRLHEVPKNTAYFSKNFS